MTRPKMKQTQKSRSHSLRNLATGVPARGLYYMGDLRSYVAASHVTGLLQKKPWTDTKTVGLKCLFF